MVNCPFHSLAVEYTDLVCGMNLDIMNGLLDRLERSGLRSKARSRRGPMLREASRAMSRTDMPSISPRRVLGGRLRPWQFVDDQIVALSSQDRLARAGAPFELSCRGNEIWCHHGPQSPLVPPPAPLTTFEHQSPCTRASRQPLGLRRRPPKGRRPGAYGSAGSERPSRPYQTRPNRSPPISTLPPVVQ